MWNIIIALLIIILIIFIVFFVRYIIKRKKKIELEEKIAYDNNLRKTVEERIHNYELAIQSYKNLQKDLILRLPNLNMLLATVAMEKNRLKILKELNENEMNFNYKVDLIVSEKRIKIIRMIAFNFVIDILYYFCLKFLNEKDFEEHFNILSSKYAKLVELENEDKIQYRKEKTSSILDVSTNFRILIEMLYNETTYLVIQDANLKKRADNIKETIDTLKLQENLIEREYALFKDMENETKLDILVDAVFIELDAVYREIITEMSYIDKTN